MITKVGGESISSPALTRAVKAFSEQAHKQWENTGSLAGFEGTFTDENGSSGAVTISISAGAMAAYDATADQDATYLSFSISVKDSVDTDPTPYSSFSSGNFGEVKDEADIDRSIAGMQDMVKEQTFGGYVFGTPAEMEAYSAAEAAKNEAEIRAGTVGRLVAGANAGTVAGDAPKPADSPDTGKVGDVLKDRFAKLQQQQTAASQLVDLLQGFLDSLGSKSKRKDDLLGADESAAPAQPAQNAIQARLAQFAGTDITA